jgi:hypothetical protein
VLFVFFYFQNGHQYKNKKNKNTLLKIQKWKDFNGNGYLQGVRHAAPYGDHFGLTLSDNLFLCRVSKGSAVRSEFNISCTMANGRHFEFFQLQKLPHTTVDIFMKFGERNPKISKIPPFLFVVAMETANMLEN